MNHEFKEHEVGYSYGIENRKKKIIQTAIKVF